MLTLCGSKAPITGRTGFGYSRLESFRKKENLKSLSVYTVQRVAIATLLKWIEELQLKKVLCTDLCSAFPSSNRQDIDKDMDRA